MEQKEAKAKLKLMPKWTRKRSGRRAGGSGKKRRRDGARWSKFEQKEAKARLKLMLKWIRKWSGWWAERSGKKRRREGAELEQKRILLLLVGLGEIFQHEQAHAHDSAGTTGCHR